jgi:hypothetical protein
VPIINRQRIKIYGTTFVAIYVVIIAALLIFRSGLLDPLGRPLGTDFLAFYTGSQLALEDQAATAYDYPKFRDAQADIIATDPPPLYWLYPPIFFLFILPLALFPYIIAWWGWIFFTGLGYTAIIKKIYPDKLTLTVTLAFPGTIQNILQGQNGFLSVSLIGGGLLLLPSRPLSAGFLFGLMTFKPHLALLLPVALLAARQWVALCGFFAGSVGLIGISLIVFGFDIWLIYFKNILFAAHMLQGGGAPLFKVPTTFALAMLLGADLGAARVLQIVVSLAVLVTIFWLWSRPTIPFPAKAAGLAIGCLLFTPYVYDYDLVILAIPIAIMAKEMAFHGTDVYGKGCLVIAWLAPLLLPIIAAAIKVQLGPIVLGLFLYIVLRTARRHKMLSNC